MEAIQDYQTYISGMSKGIEDKLFFMDFLKEHPEIDIFVDFGCADGLLISKVAEQLPYLGYLGVDSNNDMLRLAKARLPQLYVARSLHFCNQYSKVLNLSSVLHEVFHYTDESFRLRNLFNTINDSKYEYIFVRDMLFDINCADYYRPFTLDPRVLNAIDSKYHKQLMEFESYYSTSISYDLKAFIHFLMKYSYQTNWDRELKENYFSYNIGTLMYYLKNYEIVELEKFTLPFLKERVMNDFGYEITVPTHYKAILRLKPECRNNSIIKFTA